MATDQGDQLAPIEQAASEQVEIAGARPHEAIAKRQQTIPFGSVEILDHIHSLARCGPPQHKAVGAGPAAEQGGAQARLQQVVARSSRSSRSNRSARPCIGPGGLQGDRGDRSGGIQPEAGVHRHQAQLQFVGGEAAGGNADGQGGGGRPGGNQQLVAAAGGAAIGQLAAGRRLHEHQRPQPLIRRLAPQIQPHQHEAAGQGAVRQRYNSQPMGVVQNGRGDAPLGEGQIQFRRPLGGADAAVEQLGQAAGEQLQQGALEGDRCRQQGSQPVGAAGGLAGAGLQLGIAGGQALVAADQGVMHRGAAAGIEAIQRGPQQAHLQRLLGLGRGGRRQGRGDRGESRRQSAGLLAGVELIAGHEGGDAKQQGGQPVVAEDLLQGPLAIAGQGGVGIEAGELGIPAGQRGPEGPFQGGNLLAVHPPQAQQGGEGG